MASIVDEQVNPTPTPTPTPTLPLPVPLPLPLPLPFNPDPKPNPNQVKRGGFAENILQLLGLYAQLTASTALETRSPLLCLALVLALGTG
jgi:hypothetical protein